MPPTFSKPWVTITANCEKIELTANHPIWVVNGNKLGERPIPTHLDVRKDEQKQLAGRWINSQDLTIGDEFLSMTDQLVRVDAIELREVDSCAVCNLTVRDFHSFLVGSNKILAHNDSWCDILEKTHGWKKPAALVKLIEDGIETSKGGLKTMSAIHGHHIVMKEAKDVYSIASRKILEKFKISLLGTQDELRKAASGDLHNMAMAINGYKGIHSDAYAQAVFNRLQKIVDLGTKRGLTDDKIRKMLINELGDMREVLERGDSFW